MPEVKLNAFARGINNRAPSNRIPEGYVRDMVNLDPGPTVTMRTGYRKVADCQNGRAVFTYGDGILVVDGGDLCTYDPSTERLTPVYSGLANGPVCATEHNGELFISAPNVRLRYDGSIVRRWGVPTVTTQPSSYGGITGGQLPVLYAAVYENEYGELGGTCAPAELKGKYLQIDNIPDGHKVRIYTSTPGGSTLYLYRTVTAAGAVTAGASSGDGAELITEGLSEPPPCEYMTSHNGVIVMASGNIVQVTAPMLTHLVNESDYFIQYPEKVGMVVSGLHGVYVSADKCYRVDNIGTAQVRQSVALGYPAIPGTGVELKDGSAMWATRYGMAIESADIREGIYVNSAFYFGEVDSGVVGVHEHDGRVKAVMRGAKRDRQGGLAADDYFEAEIIRP